MTTFGYDAAGNQTSVLDALGHATTYIYDAANRRTQVTYPDSTFETTAYDALGRVSSRTDANGKSTQYGYDALGRLTSVTDALNHVTSYTYDEVGNRLTQADANAHTTSYQYDSRGRRTQRKLPLGQTESYAYDVNGNMSAKTDFNGKTTTYTYDSMNRLLSKIPDASFSASPVTFTYTGAGQRSTMNDASGATSYGYDSWHRPAFKNTPAGQSSYGVDAAGNLTSQSVGSYTSFYGHDALNRLSTVTVQFYFTDSTATYGYDAVGNLQSLTYSNGVAHNYSYDAKNRLTNLGVTNGGATPVPIASYAYTVDNAGHRTGVTELSGRAVNYAYDNLYRLTNETIASDPNAMNGVVSYVYDAVGNRTQKVSTLPGYPGGLTNYNANDQIGTDTYDAEGNTTASNRTGYVYDFENHLIQANGITYVYDGDGNRVSKTVAGMTTTYLVDDQNPTGYAQVLQEQVQQSGVYPVEYVYGLEQFTRFRRFYDAGGNFNRETIFYEHDGHGSVRSLTDGNGTVLNTYDYDAFGNLIHSTGTTQNNFLFAGEQFDPDLGLYYNRARYLNTSTGRFWTMDTFEGDTETPLSLHKYLYADDDPADNTDATGNQIDDVLAGVGVEDTIGAIAVINYGRYAQLTQVDTGTAEGLSAARLLASQAETAARTKSAPKAFRKVFGKSDPFIVSASYLIILGLLYKPVHFTQTTYADCRCIAQAAQTQQPTSFDLVVSERYFPLLQVPASDPLLTPSQFPSKGGAILHEAAHSAISAQDIAYYGPALRLNAADALKNADSYRLFAEHVYVAQ